VGGVRPGSQRLEWFEDGPLSWTERHCLGQNSTPQGPARLSGLSAEEELELDFFDDLESVLEYLLGQGDVCTE